MLLHVTHFTRYDYTPPVDTAQHLAHLKPMNTPSQRLVSHALKITPPPAQSSESPDVYGNTRTFFALDSTHEELVVTAESVVETSAPQLPASVARDLPWEEARERFDTVTGEHRHVEFWFFPHADHVILKTLSLIEPCEAPPRTSDIEETTFRRVLGIGAKLPFLVPSLQRLMMKTGFEGGRRGPAHAIFPSDRTIRFEEMEYEMPHTVGLETLSAVVHWIRKKRLPVSFPFEYRTVAADDIWMSPMNKGPVAAISMHQYAPMPWRTLFADAEAIFREHGGRPHWAKRHTLSRADVDALYPMAERYRAVRRAADPDGKFLNSHMAELFS